MDICANAYYNYRKDAKAEYYDTNTEICQVIKEMSHKCNGIIGHHTMRVFLVRKGIRLNKTTIYKYMNKKLHPHCVCLRKCPTT